MTIRETKRCPYLGFFFRIQVHDMSVDDYAKKIRQSTSVSPFTVPRIESHETDQFALVEVYFHHPDDYTVHSRGAHGC